MKPYRYLVLLTSAYPLYDGEFFLDDEVNILASKFEKIFTLCFHNNQKKAVRTSPKNVISIPISHQNSGWDKIWILRFFLKKAFWSELLNIGAQFKTKPSLLHLKIILSSYSKATFILKNLNSFVDTVDIDTQDILFYSYWHDEMALALSLYKQKNKGLVCIARAHGWDVDYKRHHPAYLPFKQFIIKTLDKTYTISQSGKTTFDNLLNTINNPKTEVSRLGKLNNRAPIINKRNTGFVLCSCSNIIPLKRIHLIIDIIKELHFEEIRWVHFGEGPLKTELYNYAKEHIPNVNFEFRGMVSNSLILDYYAQNYVDLFINLSETEGIPVSIMEAQSAGIPVLATDVGGVSEIVDMENGFLIKKHFQIKHVATIITNFVNSSFEEQIDKRNLSYENWHKNYNAEKNYNGFYNSIITL